MSILVDRATRVLIQGITGRTGRRLAARMRVGGTRLVAGVAPARGGQVVEDVPVFDSVAAAVAATGAGASFCCVGGAHAVDALYEAVDAGLEIVVVYAENLPVHDAIMMRAYARARGARLFGPNSAGVISPGQCNISDLFDGYVEPGRVGIVSKSGTLTYEVIAGLAASGTGVSTVACLGGDRVIGTEFTDILDLFEDDADTDAVVLIGENGGQLEYRAADHIRTMRTPVVTYITGRRAPHGVRMGHAGAIVGRDGSDSADAKAAAFTAAGIAVADLVTDVSRLVIEALDVQVVPNSSPYPSQS